MTLSHLALIFVGILVAFLSISRFLHRYLRRSIELRFNLGACLAGIGGVLSVWLRQTYHIEDWQLAASTLAPIAVVFLLLQLLLPQKKA
jgi:hypothetical protein